MIFVKKLLRRSLRNGLKKSEASEYFNISRNTINLWLKRREETGDIRVKREKKTGPLSKITDWQKFEDFVQIYGNKTQVEMTELWPVEISAVADIRFAVRTISRGLKKIGFTRKKKLMGIVKEMRKKERNLFKN